MNLIGALTGTAVAMTIASGLVDTDVVAVTSQVILCALGGGIIWNLITWWKGLPSSSSHALIGGLCGAAVSAAHNDWRSEEHTSELQSLMRISYAVSCLKKKTQPQKQRKATGLNKS